MNISALTNKYWIGSVVAFGLHQICQNMLVVRLPWIDEYLDAFLSIPVLTGLVLQERRLAIDFFLPAAEPSNYRFSMAEVIIYTAILAIVFEEGLPTFCEGYTKDYWDYLAYSLGAVFFFFYINVQRKPR